MKIFWPLIVAAGLGLVFAPTAATPAELPPPDPLSTGASSDPGSSVQAPSGVSARDRLLVTTKAAMQNWKEGRARLHDYAAKEASARAEGAPDSPSINFYTQGWDSSFDRALNAQDTFQVLFPFNLPGQTNSVRGYKEASTENIDADRSAHLIHVSLEAGQRWIERAAALERVKVRQGRVARIDDALTLHEARFQLGEVAGTEVMQLDLEHVRVMSQLAADTAANESAREMLVELCSSECGMPVIGDLEALVGETETPKKDELTSDRLESGGLLRQARAVSAFTVARSELVGRTAYGRPSVGMEWESIPSLFGVPSYDAWGATLTLPLHLGRAGKQTKAAARDRALASEERIEGARRELMRRATSALANAEAASRRLSTLDTVLPDLPSIEYSLSQQFRLGAISYLAYLDGLARLDKVRLDTVDARRELLLARLELGAILADPSVFPLPTAEEEPQ